MPYDQIQILDRVSPVAGRSRVKSEDLGLKFGEGLCGVRPRFGRFPEVFGLDLEVSDCRLLAVFVVDDIVPVEQDL